LSYQERAEFMRRSRGEGAIYQRKTGPKKGLWVAEYKVGTKRKYLYGKTKKAVTDKLKERLSSGGMNLPRGGHHASRSVPRQVAPDG